MSDFKTGIRITGSLDQSYQATLDRAVKGYGTEVGQIAAEHKATGNPLPDAEAQLRRGQDRRGGLREVRKYNPSIRVAGKVSWCWIRACSMGWRWVGARHFAAAVGG